MNTLIKQRVEANIPHGKKFDGKAQAPEVLCRVTNNREGVYDMKKLLLILILSIVSTVCLNAQSVVGSGDITQERTVLSFEKIEIEGPVAAYFHLSTDYRVDVTANANLFEYVETVVRNNVLQIKVKRNNLAEKIDVDIYCPASGITGISINGPVTFDTKDDLNVSELKISFVGPGSMNLKGSAKNVDISFIGPGTFDGGDFKIKNASVDNKAMGLLQLWVEDTLNGKNWLGLIKYRGNPKVNVTNIFPGMILRMNG
jgi:hypothetical protein